MSYGIKIFVAKECTWMCMKNNVVFFFFEQVKYLGTGVNNTENFTLKY